MTKLIKFIQKYPTHIKYSLLIFAIFLMFFAIRAYQNNLAILDAIDGVNKEKELKTDEINFNQNFLIKYLSTDYADYFLSHENSILYNNEYILRLDMNVKNTQESTGTNITGEKETNPITNSRESRKDFLGKKFKTIK